MFRTASSSTVKRPNNIPIRLEIVRRLGLIGDWFRLIVNLMNVMTKSSSLRRISSSSREAKHHLRRYSAGQFGGNLLRGAAFLQAREKTSRCVAHSRTFPFFLGLSRTLCPIVTGPILPRFPSAHRAIAGVLMLLCTPLVALAKPIVIESATFDVVGNGSDWRYSHDAGQECMPTQQESCPANSSCLDQNLLFEMPDALRSLLSSRLQGAGIALGSLLDIGRYPGIRVSITDADCSISSGARRVALPFALYSFQRDRNTSRLRAQIEFITARTREVNEMVTIELVGDSQSRTHTILLFPLGTHVDQISSTTLRRALVEQIIHTIRDRIARGTI